jgi:tripartite-type tricarboxylate transporter receptor subunit TctC
MKPINSLISYPVALVTLVSLFSIAPADSAFSQADFYSGKTITIIRGGGPGGSGEFQTRSLMRVLEKYIPGRPTLVLQYMEGAAGRKAANVIYNSTRPDGLTIGSIGAGLVVGPILGLPGSAYDLDKLIYLGSTDTGDSYIFYTKGEMGLDTLQKLRATSGLRFGAQSVGHPVYITARLFAYFLDLKEPKFVTGYTNPEIDVAIKTGELDAHSRTAARIISGKREWIEKNLVHFHATLAVPKDRSYSSFAHLPELGSLAKSETERKLLDVFRSFQYPRWPYIFPPGTPKERVGIIREAMRKAFADPEFSAEFKKLMGDDASALNGEDLERAISELPRDPDVIQLYKKMAGPDRLPSR